VTRHVQQADNSFCTPFPWNVDSHRDSEGGYVVQEANQEQLVWCFQGYDISDEEGERRDQIAAQHETGNIRLIQAAPELFVALREMVNTSGVCAPEIFAVLESVSPEWRQLVVLCHHEER